MVLRGPEVDGAGAPTAGMRADAAGAGTLRVEGDRTAGLRLYSDDGEGTGARAGLGLAVPGVEGPTRWTI